MSVSLAWLTTWWTSWDKGILLGSSQGKFLGTDTTLLLDTFLDSGQQALTLSNRGNRIIGLLELLAGELGLIMARMIDLLYWINTKLIIVFREWKLFKRLTAKYRLREFFSYNWQQKTAFDIPLILFIKLTLEAMSFTATQNDFSKKYLWSQKYCFDRRHNSCEYLSSSPKNDAIVYDIITTIHGSTYGVKVCVTQSCCPIKQENFEIWKNYKLWTEIPLIESLGAAD